MRRLFPLIAVLPLVTAACGETNEITCTMVGVSTATTVHVASGLVDRADHLVLRACVADRCNETTSSRVRATQSATLPEAGEGPDGGPATLTVLVVAGDGSTLAQASEDATIEENDINGEQCPIYLVKADPITVR